MLSNKIKAMMLAYGIFLSVMAIDSYLISGIISHQAQAQRGPASPRGAARRTSRRTARRTTRRIIRRSTIYAATLPRGCTTIYIEGVRLHQCGTTYYQPYNNRYVVVYVD